MNNEKLEKMMSSQNVVKSAATYHKQKLKSRLMKESHFRAPKSRFSSILRFTSFATTAVMLLAGGLYYSQTGGDSSVSVLAESREYHKNKIENQGGFYYSKQKITMYMMGVDVDPEIWTEESWESSKTGDYRAKIYNKDGKLVDDFAAIQDKTYHCNNCYDDLPGNIINLGNDTNGAMELTPEEIEGLGINLDLENPLTIDSIPFDITEGSGIGTSQPFEPGVNPGEHINGEMIVDGAELSEKEIYNLVENNTEIVKDGQLITFEGEINGVGSSLNNLWDLKSNNDKSSRVKMFEKIQSNKDVKNLGKVKWESTKVHCLEIKDSIGYIGKYYFDTDNYKFLGSQDYLEIDGERTLLSKTQIISDAYSSEGFNYNLSNMTEINLNDDMPLVNQ